MSILGSARWVAATMLGYALGGFVLHSPGAWALEAPYAEWAPPAAVFGAVLGSVVGLWTGALQMLAVLRRDRRVILSSVVVVVVAHALADGAPSGWGVPGVAALSGALAAIAYALIMRVRDPRWWAAAAAMWWLGWMSGVAFASGLGLVTGSEQLEWALAHAVIGLTLGLAWGAVTSPASLSAAAAPAA